MFSEQLHCENFKKAMRAVRQNQVRLEEIFIHYQHNKRSCEFLQKYLQYKRKEFEAKKANIKSM